MPRTYVTISGDTPDAIARRLWGNETLMHVLVAANPTLRGAVILDAGLVLDVPEVAETAVSVAPPWSRT